MAFTDSDGQSFRLEQLFGKPLILLLSYYGCDGTCPTMNMELAKVLAKVDRYRLGTDYRVLTVSFDKRDSSGTAAEFLRKGLAVNPDGIDANFFYGDYLFRSGDYAGAEQALKKALLAPPRPARASADEGRRGEINQLLQKVAEKRR